VYTFRIKPGTDFEELVDTVLQADDGLARNRFVADGFPARDVVTLFRMAEVSDNLTIGRHGASYTEVMPQTVIQQAERVEATLSRVDTQPVGPTVKWPDVPVVGNVADWFRRPSWYDRMRAMVESGKHISIAGPPGIGKSTAVEQLAAEMGKPLVHIGGNAGFRKRDLTGNTQLVNSHTQFMVAEYVAAVTNGWWAKIDEVNAAEPDALMFLNAQIAPPHTVNFYGMSVPVHPDFRLFVTYNPGLVGTKPLPPAFKDRFFPIKLGFPNENQLRKLLEANGMSTNDWTDVVVKFGLKAWEIHKKGRCRYQITPRRLMDAVLLVTMAGEDVFAALEQSVISMIDNAAEVRVMKDVLKSVKQEFEFGRL